MTVYKAINEVQRAISITGISKDRENKHQKYKFRGIDDVYNALSPLLSNAGLVILPRVQKRECVERVSGSGNAVFYVTLDVEFDFVAAEDGSKHTVRAFGEAMDSGDKATNKAMSAAYKYACMQTFAIPTEGDNDADATTHEVVPADDLIVEIRKAAEGKDWVTLCSMDRPDNPAWLNAWGRLDSKERAAIKALEGRRNEYLDQLNSLAEKEDLTGFTGLQDELNQREARYIFGFLSSPAQTLLTNIRKETHE